MKQPIRISHPLLTLMGTLAIGSIAAIGSNAQANSAADYFKARVTNSSVPNLLSTNDKRYYRSVFESLDSQNWSRLERLLAQRSDGPLHRIAMAEFYLHAKSPRVESQKIANWLNTGRQLPQAQQMARLGQRRGVEGDFSFPQAQSFVRQPHGSKRILPKRTSDGSMPSSVSKAILEHIKQDNPSAAQQLLDGIDANLSPAARAEWRQRVGWSYYIENNDAAAYALASSAAQGSGAWVAEGHWTSGLAAWRMKNCALAAQAFEQAALKSTNMELTAAARYWASRSYVRCREPEKAAEQLRGAADFDETLYGMLAREQLGQALSDNHSRADFDLSDWQHLRGTDNVRTAVALAEIGQSRLADEVLRHQARIGDASQYSALSRLARELGLPSTQLWMAHNAPRGTHSEPVLRYPAPRWQPVNGWKVDPALAYAHTLQESNFRAAVVSPAGARGLMQIMPAAARDHADKLGVRGNARDLSQPAVNLAFGQEHLNMLRSNSATQGRLPKIMAAYNAGLRPVARWNNEIRDQDDALLYMESIPYWETRGYVAIVMRNYWMYERQAGGASESRRALAQGEWPEFPQLNSGRQIRISAVHFNN